MKAILINPEDRTITEVEHDGTLKEMYALLKCDIIESVHCNDEGETLFDGNNQLYVDEEGLFKRTRYYFTIAGKSIAGRAITARADSRGCEAEPTVTLGTVVDMVDWRGPF